jgi:predicted nucleic acid-binding protein
LDAAHVKALARKRGSIMELADCLIDATAIRLRMPLVTGSTEDSQAVQGTGVVLRIQNWRTT